MKICVITATRAEYGLLYPIISKIEKDEDLELQLVVSGTHLAEEYGYTVREIENDGFRISIKIEILKDNKTISCIMADALKKFSIYLEAAKPDIAVILGDRYEMIGFGLALVNARIPIAHLNGGEVTEGLLDDFYRNCLTKMSTLHFANCDVHRRRIIQMGEQPQYVYNVGDTCVDNIKNTELFSSEEIRKIIHYNGSKKGIIVVTYHPVTIQSNNFEDIQNLMKAIEEFSDYYFVITLANSDEGGSVINKYFFESSRNMNHVYVIESLGRKKYLSLLNVSELVIGNSSSGIYEVPFFGIPTVNIGIRQQGRLHGPSVIDCSNRTIDIVDTMNKALSQTFREHIETYPQMWGDGTTAEKVIDIIKKELQRGLPKYKKFYDINN